MHFLKSFKILNNPENGFHCKLINFQLFKRSGNQHCNLIFCDVDSATVVLSIQDEKMFSEIQKRTEEFKVIFERNYAKSSILKCSFILTE